MTTQWKLHIRKEAYKFAAAHMTVFADGTKEPLHGHNYQVALDVTISEARLDHVIPFATFKAILGPLCEGLDERILVPGRNRFVQVTTASDETTVVAAGKRYVFPSDEVVVLPIDNITTEGLAQLVGEGLVDSLRASGVLKNHGLIRALEVRVDESNGQGASWCQDFGRTS